MNKAATDISKLKRGDRVELVYTSDPYTDLKPGDTGTVLNFIDYGRALGGGASGTLYVQWDSGSRLSILEDQDAVCKIEAVVPIEEQQCIICGEKGCDAEMYDPRSPVSTGGFVHAECGMHERWEVA